MDAETGLDESGASPIQMPPLGQAAAPLARGRGTAPPPLPSSDRRARPRTDRPDRRSAPRAVTAPLAGSPEAFERRPLPGIAPSTRATTAELDVPLAAGMLAAATSAARGDETVLSPPPIILPEVPEAIPRGLAAGTLRIPSGLPRTRGTLGDIRYALTAPFAVVRARVASVRLGAELDAARARRDGLLYEAGRAAATELALTSPIIEEGRRQFHLHDERRSHRAGQAAACEEELGAITLRHAEARIARTAELVNLRREAEQLAGALAPLEAALAATQRRIRRLDSKLGALDERIASDPSPAVGFSPTSQGFPAGYAGAAGDALMASLRAERQAVAGEEPVLASHVDDLLPKVASLRASRIDAASRIAELERLERDDAVRIAEIRAAIVARQVVEQRAVADLTATCDAVLRELGERVYVEVERPAALADRLAAIEACDVEIASLDRQVLERAELVASVNLRALGRGAAWLLLGALVIAAAVLVAAR